MRKQFARGVATVAAVLSTLAFAVSPAFAQSASWSSEGEMSFYPGLTDTPTAQAVWFAAEGPLVAANDPLMSGWYSCNGYGNSVAPETLAAGSGYLSLMCSGKTTTFAVLGPYTRRGLDLVINGTVSGDVTSSLTGACDLVPNSARPITLAKLACQFVLT